MPKSSYNKKKSYSRYSKKSYRPATSYAGKSLFTLASAMAKPGAKLATAYVKKALGLNTESKFVDTIETNVGTSSTAQPMANPVVIAQGDTTNTRQGDSVRLNRYHCKIRLMANSAATTPTFVRILFVKFRNGRGEQPGATQFLDAPTRITSHYNRGDSILASGYTILYDRTFQINIDGTSQSTKLINFKYNPVQHHLKWLSTDTTGSITNLLDGYVRGYIMTAETGANTPNYWADHRVSYVDN